MTMVAEVRPPTLATPTYCCCTHVCRPHCQMLDCSCKELLDYIDNIHYIIYTIASIVIVTVMSQYVHLI